MLDNGIRTNDNKTKSQSSLLETFDQGDIF